MRYRLTYVIDKMLIMLKLSGAVDSHDKVSCFDTITDCDIQTDGRTDVDTEKHFVTENTALMHSIARKN